MTTETKDCTVIAVLHEFHQAELQADDGFRYCFVEDMTPGIDLAALKEGQRWRCTVTARYGRVLHAEKIG